MDTQVILQRYRGARDAYQRDVGVYRQRLADIQAEVEAVREVQRTMGVVNMALVMLEQVVLQVDELIHNYIDMPITAALQTIYQDPSLGVKTLINRAGDRMEASIEIRRGNEVISGPVLDSVGGGVIDVIGFVLRLCVFRLLKGRGPIVVDEPFRHVNREALYRAAEFVRQIADDLGIQVIMVTHNEILTNAASNVIRLTGRGQVEQSHVGA